MTAALLVSYALAAAAAGGLIWMYVSKRTADKELRRTRQLFELSLEMSSTIRKQDLLRNIMATTANVMNAEASSIILVDKEKGELFFELAIGDKVEQIREIRLKIGEGIAGWVAQTGESVKIDDAAGDPRWSSKVATRTDYPTRNMLCVPVVSKGEIVGVLQVLNKRGSKPFNDRDLKLLQSIASPTAVSLENAMLYDALEKSLQALKETYALKERMDSELRIARDIQMSFLPRGPFAKLGVSVNQSGAVMTISDAGITYGSPAESDRDAGAADKHSFGAEVDAILRPAREVGGDFYDYFALSDTSLFFALGDVSDKGIPAALFMAVTMTLIKGKMSDGTTPGQLLTAVNRELCRDDSGMFATIFCGLLDTASGVLMFSDGGHCLPLLIRGDGSVEPLKGSKGLPLGVLEDAQYTDNIAIMAPGERIVLYTDGISEAEDPVHAQYGVERLTGLLQAEPADVPMKESIARLLQDVDRFARGAQQSDDIAVLMVRRNAG